MVSKIPEEQHILKLSEWFWNLKSPLLKLFFNKDAETEIPVKVIRPTHCKI